MPRLPWTKILLTLISLSACTPPKTAQQLTALGASEQSKTNSYQAINLFTQAIKKDPHYLPAYSQRAATYLSLDSLTPAIRDYDTLIYYTKSQIPLSNLYLLKANALYLNSQDTLSCLYYRKARDLNNYQAWEKIRRLCK